MHWSLDGQDAKCALNFQRGRRRGCRKRRGSRCATSVVQEDIGFSVSGRTWSSLSVSFHQAELLRFSQEAVVSVLMRDIYSE